MLSGGLRTNSLCSFFLFSHAMLVVLYLDLHANQNVAFFSSSFLHAGVGMQLRATFLTLKRDLHNIFFALLTVYSYKGKIGSE